MALHILQEVRDCDTMYCTEQLPKRLSKKVLLIHVELK